MAGNAPTPLESRVLDALDALASCPTCESGTCALGLYREAGEVRVECGTCGETLAFGDAVLYAGI